jgi:hypothetical protein
MIESCPESNAANLPSTLHAFPLLSVPTDSHPGKEIQVKYDNAQENQWAVFVSGLRSIFVPVGKGQKVTVPRDLSGLVYVIITNSDTKVDDSTTVAGPGIMMVDFDSNGKVV